MSMDTGTAYIQIDNINNLCDFRVILTYTSFTTYHYNVAIRLSIALH